MIKSYLTIYIVLHLAWSSIYASQQPINPKMRPATWTERFIGGCWKDGRDCCMAASLCPPTAEVVYYACYPNNPDVQTDCIVCATGSTFCLACALYAHRKMQYCYGPKPDKPPQITINKKRDK